MSGPTDDFWELLGMALVFLGAFAGVALVIWACKP